MPTQITINAYTFAELSDKAKGKVRERWRTFAAQDFEPDYLVDEFVEVLTACGFKVDKLKHAPRLPAIFYDLEVGPPCASFEGRWFATDVRPDLIAKLVSDRPQDAQFHRAVRAMCDFAQDYEHAYATVGTFRYGSDSVVFEYGKCDEGPIADGEPNRLEAITRNLCRCFARDVLAEYEYRQSVESIDESIEANAPDALYHADGTEIKQS